MATGPSLTLMDVEYCRGKCPVIIVNDNYRMGPWAGGLYAPDTAWGDPHPGGPDVPGRSTGGRTPPNVGTSTQSISISAKRGGQLTPPASIPGVTGAIRPGIWP